MVWFLPVSTTVAVSMGNSCSPGCISATPAHRRGVDDIRRYYKIGRVIGCGSFGQVRECTDRETGQVYAVKVMERRMSGKEKMTPGRPSNEAMIRSEVEILKSLHHENIVSFVKFFEDKHCFYAILEKCDGGELFHQIVSRRQFTEEDASALCRQMASALAYLHGQGVVHRDVKVRIQTVKLQSKIRSKRRTQNTHWLFLLGNTRNIS